MFTRKKISKSTPHLKNRNTLIKPLCFISISIFYLQEKVNEETMDAILIGIEQHKEDDIEMFVQQNNGDVMSLTCLKVVFNETWPEIDRAEQLEDSLPIHVTLRFNRYFNRAEITQCTVRL